MLTSGGRAVNNGDRLGRDGPGPRGRRAGCRQEIQGRSEVAGSSNLCYCAFLSHLPQAGEFYREETPFMKKSSLTILIVFCLVFGLSAQTSPPQPKPEDIQKNLVQVEKTQAVPDKMKAGFESITAKDSITMLTYVASDLMEGRATTTRGDRLAAEYAASLLALWKLKPGGDQPS